MKSSLCPPPRRAALLGLAAAALLCARPAAAQTNNAPFAFELDNLTASGGDAAFPVTDDLTFFNLQINEVFGNGTTATVSLANLDTGAISETTPVLFDATGAFPVSATLSGTIGLDGFPPSPTLDLTLQPSLDPASQTTQTVSTSFSTPISFPTRPGAPAPVGVGVGQFSLLFGNDALITAPITVAAVPEASTTVSLGVLLALGLGALTATRRRAARAS